MNADYISKAIRTIITYVGSVVFFSLVINLTIVHFCLLFFQVDFSHVIFALIRLQGINKSTMIATNVVSLVKKVSCCARQ